MRPTERFQSEKRPFTSGMGCYVLLLTKGIGGCGGVAFGNLWEGMMPVGESWWHCPGKIVCYFFYFFYLGRRI